MIILKLILWPLRLVFYSWHKFRLLFKSGSVHVHKIPQNFVNNQPGGLLSAFLPDSETLFFEYLLLLDFFEKNEQLKTLIVDVSHLNLNWSQTHVIAERFKKIQNSGTELIGFTEGGNLICLYILASFKRKYATPHAGFITALPSGESYFIKNTLSRFGIQLETSIAGKFKAGGFETFTRTGFSATAKKSQSRLIGSFRDQILFPFRSITIKSSGSTKKATMSDFIIKKSLMDASELKDIGFFKDLVIAEGFFDFLYLDNQKVVTEKQKHDFYNNNVAVKEEGTQKENSKTLQKKKNKNHKTNSGNETVDSTNEVDRDSARIKAQKVLVEQKQLLKRDFRKKYKLFNFKKAIQMAIVNLEGTIGMGKEDENPGGNNIKALPLRKTFKELETTSEEVVFLYINSPGGSAEASEILYHSIKSLSRIKPVIAVIGGVAASGGYYLACAANQIYANPFSLLGSIGVIRLRPQIKEFYKKMGIKKEKIFIDPTADIFTENGQMSIAAKKLNQDSLNKTYELFIDRVVEGRNLKKQQVLNMAEGQVFLSEPYIKAAMIEGNLDLIGTVQHYLEKMNYKPDSRFYFNIYPQIKMNLRSMVMSGMPGTNTKYLEALAAFFPTTSQNNLQSLDFIAKNLNKPLCYDLGVLEMQ